MERDAKEWNGPECKGKVNGEQRLMAKERKGQQGKGGHSKVREGTGEQRKG